MNDQKYVWMQRILRVAGMALVLGQLGSAYAADVNCGDTITADTVVTGGDVTTSVCAEGLTVEGVALDLNGWTLRGDGSTTTTGVVLSGRGARLQHGVVRDFGTGIELAGEGRHRISELLVIDSYSYGVRVVSDDNRIENVAARGSKDTGFHSSGQGIRIASSYAYDNVAGFVVAAGSASILSSVAAANSSDGFRVQTADSIVAVDNRSAENGGSGFDLESMKSLRASNNTATSNDGIGFYLGNIERVKLSKNVSVANQTIGFYFEFLSGATVTGNLSISDSLGFDIENSTGLVLTANQVIRAGAGAEPKYTIDGGGMWIWETDAKLRRNTVVASANGGFYIDENTDLSFADNTVVGAGNDGVHQWSGGSADLRRTRIMDSAGDGIELEDGAQATVRNSTVFASNQDDVGAVDLADGGACAATEWQSNYFGTTENPDSGVHRRRCLHRVGIGGVFSSAAYRTER